MTFEEIIYPIVVREFFEDYYEKKCFDRMHQNYN